jgi:hypothetical protein
MSAAWGSVRAGDLEPKPMIIRTILAVAALTLTAAPALAQDGAQTPLRPADAAGTWTLESKGADICHLQLSARPVTSGVYAATVPANCGDLIPAGTRGWSPTADGMALVGDGGAQLIAFNRWSNSLFVSHRSSGEDIQLKRGASANLGR